MEVKIKELTLCLVDDLQAMCSLGAELNEIETGRACGLWIQGPPLNNTRFRHTCVAFDGGLIALGGWRTMQRKADVMEVYNPAIGRWQETPIATAPMRSIIEEQPHIEQQPSPLLIEYVEQSRNPHGGDTH